MLVVITTNIFLITFVIIFCKSNSTTTAGDENGILQWKLQLIHKWNIWVLKSKEIHILTLWALM